ncbi:hypothetical protein FUA26_07745 [Seonamhaeicola algicola]|uniref:Uncharacterized protein n=1 Tax=Seonamhaeicola algicola TaxID=1719036 RepID=A0A5C7AUD9_9FLAO|nr:hypothetical protein [Seonamhaeicola algicola]TXE11947.1 hypothetical protein FUA26_07745 [Seonamhaeicola algicola]
MKNTFLIACMFLIVSCKSDKNNTSATAETPVNTETEANIPETSNTNFTPYIVINVSDRSKERIDETEDFAPAEVRTTHIKNKGFVTTLKMYLGSFEDAHYYGLNLAYIRNSGSALLETKTYKIATTSDMVKIDKGIDAYFESLETFDEEAFITAKSVGTINDFTDDFYAPLNDDNILVIEAVEDLGKSEDNAYYSESFQRIKGYLVFNVIKMITEKPYTIRVDFDVINEIRLPVKKD